MVMDQHETKCYMLWAAAYHGGGDHAVGLGNTQLPSYIVWVSTWCHVGWFHVLWEHVGTYG